MDQLNRQEDAPLESWKEIAGYLQKDITTVRRWERREGLPVHRHAHQNRSSVYAFSSEIDAWRAGRKVVPEPDPRPVWKIPAFALTMLLCLVMVGNGVRPMEAQGAKGTAKRLVCSGDCADTEANLSVDGRTMVQTDWDTGDLAIRNVKTGQQRRLMARSGSYDDKGDSGAYGEKPLFSPDMRQIAYFWDAGKDKDHQLRIMPNATGGQGRVLAENPEYDYFGPEAWSSDGKSVLVNARKQSDRTWQFAWVSVSDGAMKAVASLEWRDQGAPSLSPDGRYIAYAASAVNPKAANSKEKGDVHIYLMASDGSGMTALVKTAGINTNPIWAPDGKHVLFVSDRSGTLGLWSIGVRDGKPEGAATLIRSDLGDITGIGIRGGAYYYVQKEPGVEYVSFAGMTPAGMKSSDPAREGFVGIQPKWSPDGKSISFKRHHQGSTSEFDLIIHSVETGDEKMYADNVAVQNRPEWLYDGRSIKVALPQAVSRIDLQTGEIKPLPAGGFLSPADPTLYHLKAGADGRLTQIVAVDLNTGQERVVWTLARVNAAFRTGTGSLSRDGKTVTFIVRDQDGNHFASVHTDGTGYREIPAPPEAGGGYGWTADGRSLLFIEKQNEKSRFMRISAEGGQPEFTGIEVAGNIQSWDVNSDGTLAYNTTKTVWELWAIDNIAAALK